jgi:GT2 family glycosyltransferase
MQSRISVIIPTHNGANTLARCLQALKSSSLSPYEIIVVDDASSDDSSDVATRLNCRVIRSAENIGAARAKNVGAQSAIGEILFFTDDDVMVAPDALECAANDFADAGVAGVVGLFTTEMPFADFASNYKNLWMRFTYERVPRANIGLFYTSAAAIRRDIFVQLGGFDENYRGASIGEDTEFGQRVWGAGHNIFLDPRVRVTHAKHYTLARVLATDWLRARALTLMRLRKRGQPFFTSVPLFYQLAVPTIFAALAALVVGRVIGNGSLELGGLLLLLAFYFLFAPWLIYLARLRGIAIALYAALVQPIDAMAVGLGMLTAMIDFARGVKY